MNANAARICREPFLAEVLICIVFCSVACTATAGDGDRNSLPDVARLFTDDVVPVRPPRGGPGTRFGRRPNPPIGARAKQIVAQPFPGPGQPGTGVLILADRRMIQRLKKARELVGQKKFSDALTLLQIILDADEDNFFHPDPAKKTLYRSLKAATQQLIGTMSAAGLEAYELQHGLTARAMLDEALRQGDVDGIAEVSRRFFYTKAGREAMYRMGTVHFDQARPLAAALCFTGLLASPRDAAKWEPALSLQAALCWARAGMPNKAGVVLENLRKQSAGDTVRVGGRDVELFPQGGDGNDWLAKVFTPAQKSLVLGETDWTMFRGNAARNGVLTGGSSDIRVDWESSVPTVYDVTRFPTDTAETENDKLLKKTVEDVRAVHQQQKRIAFPQGQPLLVNGTMYVRTLGNVTALDPRDGSRRWESHFDATIGPILGENENAVPGPSHSRLLQMLVSERIWDDSTYGTMSSDGRFLYAVEGTGLSSVVYWQPRNPVLPSKTNTLVAYHLTAARRIGQRAWTLGGPKDDPLFENPLAGTFFLGAPLPLGGQLYCLAEVGGEIRLWVLDPQRPGEPLWSQPLAAASLPIDRDARRRLAGTSVSYADGIMVCPTEAGYVIAVDLTHRSLLWGYRYQPQSVLPRPPGRPPRPMGRTGWLDSAVTIADGHVLLTPRYSNDVYCLNLLDGSLAWQKKKSDGLYLAGVVDGKVLLVGSNTVEAWSLKDKGNPAWKKAAGFPTPSGRGFIRDGLLYLPLSTAQVAVVDVATGNVVTTAKTPKGVVPGNLLVLADTIISQGVDRIDVLPLPVADAQKVAAETSE